ncbi:LytR/AlgR family response regulator transcription factor [Sediminitomix flava]|uniref:LytTR family two component transcriptional regulator n=1 Tax=Sediminitomix flava TaxID=379075 RepID=A0A315ZBE0_SEDFL|nr:LytTR family DNA-binding domain-containing protein [Sediminitomix flava]PWJ42034.1 LytTR family two component transcriptional regulator [Sediminitomix flava]
MNCLIVDDEGVSRLVVKDFIERTEGLNFIGEFDNAVDAFREIKNLDVDILFLDIEMPNMTGIELVQILEDLPEVILITGRNDFASEAFDYQLTDYLIKPINYPRFLQAVEKALTNISKGTPKGNLNEDFFIKTDNKIVRINPNDIYFIEALSDYVIINVLDKKFIVHYTMKGLERKLPQNFIRVHRSFIINMRKMEAIEDLNVVMPQKHIPIGASYKNNFMDQLNFL